MIIIQNVLVSEEIIEEQFLCNLNACKGACCWEGDSGAPLDVEELSIIDKIYPIVKPFLTKEGIQVIENEGAYKYWEDAEEYGTNLVNNGPCVFITYDQLGIAKCGIEQAYQAGLIDFKKPISCHLYPIRVRKNEEKNFEALNYDEWEICSAACEAGKKAQLPVYQFVKDAIIRKYGIEFYEELEGAAEYLKY